MLLGCVLLAFTLAVLGGTGTLEAPPARFDAVDPSGILGNFVAIDGAAVEPAGGFLVPFAEAGTLVVPALALPGFVVPFVTEVVTFVPLVNAVLLEGELALLLLFVVGDPGEETLIKWLLT